jgi:hypothetical protein
LKVAKRAEVRLRAERKAGQILICGQVGGQHAEKAMRLMREVMPAADTHEEAGAKGGRGKKAVDNINSFPKGGTSETYIQQAMARTPAGKPLEADAGGRNNKPAWL